MSTHPDSPADDAAFLDDLFARALDDVAEGQETDLTAVCAERPHLRGPAEALLARARRLRAPGEALNGEATAWPEIPDLQLERELGRGGMGVVWLARDRTLGDRPVAVKVLATSWSTELRERFLAEAAALARVRHPNVLVIHGLREFAGGIALITEFVDGPSLAAQVVAERRSPQVGDSRAGRDATYVRIAIAVARALGAVHRAGLLHRDVKPSNILLRADGTPLLGDFGLVRDQGGAHETRSGQFLGTPAFASPEQLRGESRGLDARADVFGLGATLHFCIAGAPPAGTGTVPEILRRHEQGRVPRLRARDRGVARDLETIVAKAIDPEPRRRYDTADAFADDLERLLALRPVHARRVGLVGQAWRFAQRRPATAVLLLLLGVGLPLLTAGALWVVPIVHAAAARETARKVEDAKTVGYVALAEILRDEPSRALRERGTVPAVAASAFAEAMLLSPDDEEARGGAALVHLRCGQPDAALRLLPPTGTSRATELLRAAAFRRQRQPGAEAATLAAAPKPATTFDWVVELMVGTAEGNFTGSQRAEALRAIRRAILTTRYPRLLHFVLLCQRMIDDERERDRLEEWVDAMVETFPAAFAAQYTAGVTLRRLGKPEKALPFLRSAAAMAPDSAIAANALGNGLFDLQQSADARAAFETALRLDPRYPEALYNLGNLERAGGDRDAAEGHYRRAIELAPTLAVAWLNLVVVLMDRGRYEEAYGCAQEQLRLAPKSVRGIWNLAVICFETRRYAEAEVQARARLAAVAADDECRYLLAQTLQRLRRSPEALPLFEAVATGRSRFAAPAKEALPWVEEQIGSEAMLASPLETIAAREARLAAARSSAAHDFPALASDLAEPLATWLHDDRRWADLVAVGAWAATVAGGHGSDAPREPERLVAYAARGHRCLRQAMAALLAERAAGGVTAEQARTQFAAWQDEAAFASLRGSQDPEAQAFWQRLAEECKREE